MRVQDIKIGENYRHRTSPDYGYAKVLKILKPKKDDFLKSLEERKIKCIVIKCEWSSFKNANIGLIKYFKPRNLVNN